MRGFFNVVCTLLLGLSLSAHAFESRAQSPAQTITIAADEWCPINCAKDAPQQGIGIDLARRVFEPMGFKVNYVIMPWDKALDAVREGKVSAVIGAAKSDDPNLIFPDNPVTQTGDNFFVRTGSAWRYQGPHTLKGKRIGIIEDYGYGEIIQEFIKQNRYATGILTVAKGQTPLDDNIAKLLEGKIDALVESKIVMEYKLKKTGMADKISWAGTASRDPVYLAFSPAQPASKRLAALYDAAVRSMKANGALGQMYGAYGMQP